MTPELLAALTAIVGTDRLSTTTADRDHHSRDQSSHTSALPDVVLWPETTDEVSAVLRLADANRIPVVGWGAGTSLEGQPVPTHGGFVIDFGRMNRIIAVHERDFQVTVQPGMLYRDMNAQLARHGLFFAPDPGANASIGGMIANNAAGTRTVRYGATRDNVLALEVVLANGAVIRTGSRSVKQSAGYDLTHLFTGSEGTLGLVTAATLKLAPLPEFVSAITVAFETVEQAADAVFGIIGSGLNPAALELLDAWTIDILKPEFSFALQSAPHLFIEFHGASQAALESELGLAEEICREAGCTRFEAGLGREAHSQLWEVRHRTFEIMVQHHPGMRWLVTDVAVPISRYPEMVAFAHATGRQLGVPGGMVGHAGDGNLHTINFYPPDDPSAQDGINQFNTGLVGHALALGGTCTGEHGVGIGKQKFMLSEHGEGALTVMRQIKLALDPHNILNPGKVISLT